MLTVIIFEIVIEEGLRTNAALTGQTKQAFRNAKVIVALAT